MTSKIYALSVIIVAVLLASCSGDASKTSKAMPASAAVNGTPGLDEVRKASFPADQFKEKLRTGYLALSDYEWNNKNPDSAKLFGRKAAATLTNFTPDMEGLFDRDIDLQKLNDLLGAKYYVDSAMVAGLKEKDPLTAAQAQISFDCWAEQSTKKHPQGDMRPCRDDFNNANAKIATFMSEVNHQNEEQKRALEEKVQGMKTTAVDPRKMPEYSLIFYKFNSTELGVTAKGIIGKVAADIKLFHPKKVVLSGNADQIGSYNENMKLAMKRGQIVADYLVKNYNVDPALLDVKAYGLNNPRVDPDSKKKEVRNRYVQIIFLKDNKTYYEDNNNQ
jgi:OOP family OmpA-OmpF porin